jgi:hypothetical protein
MDTIWIKNRKYFLYDTYSTGQEAIKIAKQAKKEDKKTKYFIITTTKGIIPHKIHKLYFNNIQKLRIP